MTTYPRACMQAPYAAQYRVIGGSGAGSGGSVTSDPWAVCGALAAAVSEAPLFALPDAAAAEAVAVVVVVPDAAVAAVAVAALAAGALAAGADAAAGMLAPIGIAEKLLGGNGGLDGAPVDKAFDAAGLRGGICGSWTMSTFV